MTLRAHVAEALVGLLVVVATLWLVFSFWQRGGARAGGDAIEVTALFANASGIDVGTDVRVAGLSVGRVIDVALDPEGYQAEVRMAIDPAANLPGDSSAAITSEGLLGGSYIAMLPGGSDQPLANEAVIMDTQGAIDMMGLVGSMINDSGGDSGGDDLDTMSEDLAAPPADLAQ